jgi:putative tricarboxylic transport membrane protein
MLDALSNLMLGFEFLFTQPVSILLIIAGVVLGGLAGAIPGLTSKVPVAILIPLSGGLPPVGALAMFVAASESASFADTLPAILFRVPGDASAAASTLDGYELTKKGKAGYAMGAGAGGSFVGGLIGILIAIFLTPYLTEYALAFSPPEFFWMGVLGITLIAAVSKGPLYKGLVSGFLGFIISLIGMSIFTSELRLTFGIPELIDGVDFVAVLIGLFAISEMIRLYVKGGKIVEKGAEVANPMKDMWRGVLSAFKYWTTTIRAALIGFAIGIIPGAGKGTSIFYSYMVESKIVREKISEGKTDEDPFGSGNIKGVLVPDVANSATPGGALIPTLTLGIPGSSGMALIMAALMFHGYPIGPALAIYHPEVVYGIFAGVLIGIPFAFLLYILLIKPMTRLVTLPVKSIVPVILVISMLGIYTLNNSMIDVAIAVIFGIIGYYMDKYDYSPVCMIIGVILGPIVEQSLFQSLRMSFWNPAIFFTRPLSILLIVIILTGIFYSQIKRIITGKAFRI